MTCIELTIIELVMLSLMIYEKIKLKPQVMIFEYYKIEPKVLDNSQVNVMSSLIDDPMYDSEKKPFAIRTKVKSKGQDENLLSTTMKWVEDKQVKNKKPEIQEYYERRRMLERMISKIYSKDSSIPGKAETTVDLIQKL